MPARASVSKGYGWSSLWPTLPPASWSSDSLASQSVGRVLSLSLSGLREWCLK